MGAAHGCWVPSAFACHNSSCSLMCSACILKGRSFLRASVRFTETSVLRESFCGITVHVALLCEYKVDAEGVKALIGNWPV